MADGWTITEAVEQLDPVMPRRELARRLKDVRPVGTVYGRKGRRAASYPIGAVLRAHAAWVRSKIETERPRNGSNRAGSSRLVGVDVRNGNRNVGSRELLEPELPELDLEEPPEWMSPELVEQVLSDPAFQEIARALACAKYLDLDIRDPDVVAQVVSIGRRRFVETNSTAHVRRPKTRGLHEPIIYYMALGNLVKIGTSTNIITRHAILGRPIILAIERGDVKDEAERHKFFAALAVHGEWFRHEDPLASYVKSVASGFPGEFGTDLESWILSLRHGSKFRRVAAK